MPNSTFFNLPEEKKDRIEAAVIKCFTTMAYSEVSISAIIREADIPRGSFDGDDEQNHKGGLGAGEEAAARSPKTGDANSLLMLFGTMIAAVGTMYAARKRKED